jgi:aminopeptidase N
MEHQGMIAIALREVQRKDSANIVAAHELAHQWFGDCVTPQDFRYAWLSESFATFSESTWLENIRGASAYLASVQSKARNYITQIAPNEGIFPLEDFPRASPSSNYPATIYQKGAVVLAMARAIAGDSAFFDALRNYVQRNAYGNATTSTFREAIRPALGERTDAFFNEWVTGKGWAQLEVDNDITARVVHVRQVQQEKFADWPLFTTLPLNVSYMRRDGTRMIAVDTVLFPNAEGRWTIACDSLIGVNVGTRSRVLAEVVRQYVSVVDEAHNSTSEQYSVAPNPAQDRLRITRARVGSEARVSIVDVQGVVVLRERMRDGSNELVMVTADLPQGSYSVVIEDHGGTYTLPLIVTRAE